MTGFGNFSKRSRPPIPALLMSAAILVAGAGSESSAAATAAPAAIDLNAFDAMKKTVALPNGETLAYIQMGNPSGPPLVMVHGYTDGARGWVPMLPYVSKRSFLEGKP